MPAHYAISDVASLMGEPTRAAILLALLDGRALPAGQLAAEARLSAAATSLHLAKMTQGGLLEVHQEGRHRYYRLASEDVAHALEALGVLATAAPRDRNPPRDPEKAALRTARTCYDHLAGALAVGLARRLEADEVLRASGDRAYEVSATGARWFADVLGIDVEALAVGRRTLARRCLDWTERRPHVAGALGAAMLDRMRAMRWVATRIDSRAVRVTPRGTDALAKLGVRAVA